MFFFFSSFSLLQVMGEEKQTVVPKPFAEFLSENMKKTDGAFPVYQEGNRVYMPCLYVLNKIDQISIEELDILAEVHS